MNKVIGYIGVFFWVLIAVLVFLLVQLLVIYAFRFLGIDIQVYHGLFTAVYSLFCIAAFVAYDKIRSFKRERLIMTQVPKLNKIIAAVVIAFGLLGIVTLYMYIASFISLVFAPVADKLEEYSDHIDRFADVSTTAVPYWDSLIEFISTVMFVPLAEELAFRGAIFGEFKTRFNVILSAFLSALVFGLMHGVSIQIGYALICGVIIACVYYYSGSIWVTYVIHAVFNLFGSSLFTLLESGIFGQMGESINEASWHASVFEIICIVPAAAAFILLYRNYKSEHLPVDQIKTISEQGVIV